MNWPLTTCFLALLIPAHALELTNEELQRIIGQPSSAEVIPELRMYPTGECRYRLKVNFANGTADFLDCSTQQRYVDGRYVVFTPQPTDRLPRQQVRAYDPDLHRYFGWDVFADGQVTRLSGIYDQERKLMSWVSDDPVRGRAYSLRSIQSFADRALITWTAQVCVDNVFAFTTYGECQPITPMPIP